MVQKSRPSQVVPLLITCPSSFLFEGPKKSQSHTTAYTLTYSVLVVQSRPFPQRVTFVYSWPRPNSTSLFPLISRSPQTAPANLPQRSGHLDFTPPLRVKITLLC